MAALSVIYSNFCGMVVSESRNGVESDYVSDTLGSTIGLLDAEGTMTDRWEYWPYGEVVSRTGTSVTPLTFLGVLGYFQDVQGKLFYVRARHFRADLARWLTLDPLWPDESAFTCVRGIPTGLVDSSGTAPGGCSSNLESNLQANICTIAASYLAYKCAGGNWCSLVCDLNAQGTLSLTIAVKGMYIGFNNPCVAKVSVSCKQHSTQSNPCPKGLKCSKQVSCDFNSTIGFSDPGPIPGTYAKGVTYSITNITFKGTISSHTAAKTCVPTLKKGPN